MSQSTSSALQRIEHDLDLDAARWYAVIPVDSARHDRLLERRAALEVERDTERREWVSVLERHARREAAPVPQDAPLLAPMGADETIAECERRVYFGAPPRTLAKWI